VVRRSRLGRLAATLLGAAAIAFAHAQAPEAPATESQARYWVYGAFLTHAVPEIIGEHVALGPELAQRLRLPQGADRARVYDALMSYTDGKPLRVRKATPEEIARYKPQVKRELKDPVFTVVAGDIALLVEYDMQDNSIPFVGQLGVAYQPPPVAAPRAAPVPPPPPLVAVVAPKPVPARVPPPPAEPLKSNGPCVVKPVMSEQDMANCRAVPRGVARVQSAPPPPPAPVVVKPQARAVPPPPQPTPVPQRTGPCEVKPVMTEEDLANCRAVGEARVIQPGPPAVVKPQAVAKPAVSPTPQRAARCEVKAVMTEEDLANCRAVGEARVIQPGPPAVVKPQARAEPAPQSRHDAPCEVKPVMTEEDLAACRNAPGGAARVQPGPPPTTVRSAAPPEPSRKPAATPCVVKPVMSEEDLIACGIRQR
jgi:hypothetical protein